MSLTSSQYLCLAALLAAVGYLFGRTLDGLARFIEATGHSFLYCVAVTIFVIEVAAAAALLCLLFRY